MDKTYPTVHINEALIKDATAQFIGEIDQKPPLFSAIKRNGERLYNIARRGEVVPIKSRKISIYEFEITRIALPEVDFRVKCSKGTYIRSLANDFGRALNSGAYLSALRRTKIGDLSVNDAMDPLVFVNKVNLLP